jgi:hypothetical protein
MTRARVSRLLCIGDVEAAAVLRLSGGDAVPLATLAAELNLSPGPARVLAATLVHEALAAREPVPARPDEVALHLTPGAARELTAALLTASRSCSGRDASLKCRDESEKTR